MHVADLQGDNETDGDKVVVEDGKCQNGEEVSAGFTLGAWLGTEIYQLVPTRVTVSCTGKRYDIIIHGTLHY